MKVLHILDHSLPLVDGYSARSAQILSVQATLGIEPVVLTSPSQQPAPVQASELVDGVRHHRILGGRPGGPPILRELAAVRRLRARLEEVVDLERPAILHAHSPSNWGAATASVARRHGLAFVYEARGLWEGDRADGRVSLRHRLGRRLDTRVARRADAVVAISAPLRADLITRGVEPDHVHVVPNGVDAVVHAPREPDPELVARLRLEGAVCLGYVGSLYPFEGVEDLVRAMPLILREAPRTRLLIVGRDPQARIAKLVGALSLEGQVHALGAVPRSETRRYYSVMDVLIYPRTPNRTTRLVTPLKPLEALAMAKPVIASDVGGLRELLGDQALFFRAGDREDLAARCLELLRAPEQRLAAGRRGRQHVLAERQWSRVLRAYAALYEQVCK